MLYYTSLRIFYLLWVIMITNFYQFPLFKASAFVHKYFYNSKCTGMKLLKAFFIFIQPVVSFITSVCFCRKNISIGK